MSDPTYKYSRTSEVLLELKSVSLTFDKPILGDVNATVVDVEREECVQGQVICFLGPSGIGKTQLSRIIAGLQTPTSGQVLLHGKPVRPGMVCMVPQNYPMFEYTTVRGNLGIAGRQSGLTKDQINAKASELVDTFGLGDYLDMYPCQLSGGTRQRVAIARQMMCASNYMVMDEPFSGLDPIMKKRATDAIIKLSQLDTYNTIIVVTHDVTEGMSIADTVWLMGYPEKDPSKGATILERLDLAEMGFAWRPDLESIPEFRKLVRDVKAKFQELR